MRTHPSLEKFPLAAVLLAALVTAGCAYQPSISGFRPEYPPLTATFFSPPSNIFDVLNWPKVDSLQPTLRWQPLPGEHWLPWPLGNGQAKPFVETDTGSISDVRYDLRIWTVVEGSPGELAYDVEGLPEPAHKIERPLQPDTKYYWSVRARFNLEGQPKVSEWSLTQMPCPPAYGFECARGYARHFGRIPPLNYYRFKTPLQ